MTARKPDENRAVLLAVALALATLAVYARTVTFDFTGLDDQGYVSSNPIVLKGLTAHGFLWAFRTFYCANWHPLTWLSLMVDAEIGGRAAAIYHASNALLHALNSVLLFTALKRLTGREGRSAFAAALFALHPLHVESVAWVAERKDVLSTAFLLLALIAYAAYAKRPSLSGNVKVHLLFACGLMAKPMLVTFPFILLLLDFWPLGRIPSDPGRRLRTSVLGLARGKSVLFILALVSSGMTVVAQTAGGAVQSLESLPLWVRVENAIVSYAVYLVKTVWPTHLAILYPHPGKDISQLSVAASAAMLAILAFVAFRQARAKPYLLVGFLWYVITLLPVIGIVQVGAQARADRYTYIPLIGVFVALSWLVADFLEARPAARRALQVAGAAVLVALAAGSFVQAGYWENRFTLVSRINAAIPDYPLAENSLGNLLYEQGEIDEAEKHFRAFLSIKPDHAGAHNNVAMCLLKQGRADEGLSFLDAALRLDPAYAKARENRARALLALGRVDESLKDYAKAVSALPKSATAHAGYAEALVEAGDLNGGAQRAREAIEIAPMYARASNTLGVALFLQGDVEGAAASFLRATEAAPDFADAHANLSGALIKLRRVDDAGEQALLALSIKPDHPGAHQNLGLVHMLQGRPDDARREFLEVLRLRPGDPNATRYLQELERVSP